MPLLCAVGAAGGQDEDCGGWDVLRRKKGLAESAASAPQGAHSSSPRALARPGAGPAEIGRLAGGRGWGPALRTNRAALGGPGRSLSSPVFPEAGLLPTLLPSPRRFTEGGCGETLFGRETCDARMAADWLANASGSKSALPQILEPDSAWRPRRSPRPSLRFRPGALGPLSSFSREAGGPNP